MNIKIFPYLSLLALVCITLQAIGQRNTISEKSPNLIFIIADDLGYADVGFNGCKDIPTPNIDRIAQEGVKFTNGYVSYPVCGPSRAGIITGRYQDRFGFGRNPLFTPNDSLSGLPLSEETLADVLSKANYKSAAIGKWHLGAHSSQHPLERGFDDFYGFLSGGHQYFPEKWTLADEFEAKSQNDGYRTKLLRNHERVEEKEYLTDALSREAVNYITKFQDSPFFLYLAYNAPHTPLQATEKYLDRFKHIENKKRRTYAAMVSAVDDGIGRILDQVAKLDLEEETIICFISDNGGPTHRNASNNDPLRGKKGDVFEGGIRVPFAMKWPGVIQAGMVYAPPVISLDIFATIIAQSEKDLKTKNVLDGVDLIPYLRSEKEGMPHDMLFWRKFDQKTYAMRLGNEKFIEEDSARMIFALGLDIGEENNLINEKGNAFTEKWMMFEQWNNEIKDPNFLGLRHNKIYDSEHPDRFKRKVNKELEKK